MKLLHYNIYLSYFFYKCKYNLIMSFQNMYELKYIVRCCVCFMHVNINMKTFRTEMELLMRYNYVQCHAWVANTTTSTLWSSAGSRNDRLHYTRLWVLTPFYYYQDSQLAKTLDFGRKAKSTNVMWSSIWQLWQHQQSCQVKSLI